MRGGHFATKKKSSWRERGASTRLFSLFSTIKCLPILRHSNACTMYVDQAVGTEWQPTKEWSEHLRARDGVNKLSIFHLAVSRVWEIAVIGCDVNELLIRVRLDSLKQKVFFFRMKIVTWGPRRPSNELYLLNYDSTFICVKDESGRVEVMQMEIYQIFTIELLPHARTHHFHMPAIPFEWCAA